MPVANGVAAFDTAGLGDGKLHFYQSTLPQGTVRWFALRVGSETKVCLDACEICGDKGYFQGGNAVVCRNCTSPIVVSSIGRTGGCNPIPLEAHAAGGRLELPATTLEQALPKLKGR